CRGSVRAADEFGAALAQFHRACNGPMARNGICAGEVMEERKPRSPEQNPLSLEQNLDGSLQVSDPASGVSARIDCSPENIEQGLAKLVLGLIELLRQ